MVYGKLPKIFHISPLKPEAKLSCLPFERIGAMLHLAVWCGVKARLLQLALLR
jgi:hypothetical protein